MVIGVVVGYQYRISIVFETGSAFNRKDLLVAKK
jgi:hypothetical protein